MAENLKSALAHGKELVGTFLKTPSAMVCEVLSATELDVVCIDAEHSPFDRIAIDQCIHALSAGVTPSLVRIPSARDEHILNALDCGATGVVVPHVKSAEIARDIARAAHFGAGGRGYAGSTRAAAYTGKAMPQHLADSNTNTVLIAQIEDVEALDELEGIAAVAGIDCLFVGRIDLTVAMGASSAKDDQVVSAVTHICKVAKQANKPVGMFVADLTEIPYWREQGASLFLLSSDHGFLLSGARDLLAQVRGD